MEDKNTFQCYYFQVLEPRVAEYETWKLNIFPKVV